MNAVMERKVNDAFRILRKRIRLFAKRHVDNVADVDDMTNQACEKAFKRFRALTANIELRPENLDHFMDQACRRALTAVHGARIDHYRRMEIQRRFFESLSPDVVTGSWFGGSQHAPAPDQSLIVEQTMAAVMRHSTTPGQKRLGQALLRHVDNGDLDVSPSELAAEAGETPNCRHAWARKLKTKRLG